MKKKFCYFVNYKEIYKELYQLEIESILGFLPEQKYFFLDYYFDESKCSFVRGCLNLDFSSNSLEELVELVKAANLYIDSYKIEYIKVDKDVSYDQRLNAMRDLGFAIEGEFAITNPGTKLAVTKIDGVWYFGEYLRNNNEWMERVSKPIHYSIALETRLAHSLINIAASKEDITIVDPCCGIGTILIEAKKMGVEIDGYDINRKVVWHANKNLKHYGLEPDAKASDISEIEKHYDVAIVDLPYGQFVKAHKDSQQHIIESAKKLADKVIFVCMENKDDYLLKQGFEIEGRCIVPKVNQFKRYIYVVRS